MIMATVLGTVCDNVNIKKGSDAAKESNVEMVVVGCFNTLWM